MESAATLLTFLVVTALGVPVAAQRVEFEAASVRPTDLRHVAHVADKMEPARPRCWAVVRLI